MRGELVQFAANGATQFQAYVSRPESGSGPGVIVIQEYWGLVDHIKDLADRFASEGFVALAPDLYGGAVAKEPDEAGKLMMSLNIAESEKILSKAVDHLLAEPATASRTVGVIGFCMGGQLSLFAASVNERVSACVDFYGIHPNVHPDYSRLRGPVLGIFAEDDAYAGPEAVAALDEALTRAGKAHEFHTYAGTHHAFFNDTRPTVYDPAAATDSWRRVLAFFREHVK